MMYPLHIDLKAEVRFVAKALKKDLTDNQVQLIADKLLSNYCFNDWIEAEIERLEQ